MLAKRLVNMVEEHAEQLTDAVVLALRTDSRTPAYHRLGRQEEHARVFAVIHNLGRWLDTESDTDTERDYRRLGGMRFSQRVPLAEVICALTLTKQIIRHFIEVEGWMDSALDLRQQLEVHALISRFFERAIYFTVLGYEVASRVEAKPAAHVETPKRRFVVGWARR